MSLQFAAGLPTAVQQQALVLSQVNGQHVGAEQGSPRSQLIAFGDERLAPHPNDVPALMALLLTRIDQLWSESVGPYCDLRIAALAVWGVVQVQPFASKNEETAIDWAQLLLAHRWNVQQPPLKITAEAEKAILGTLQLTFSEADALHPTAASFRRVATEVANRFTNSTLSVLLEDPAIGFLAAAVSGTKPDNKVKWA